MESLWNETVDLWAPVIDWVNEQEFADFIGFQFHPFRIEWYWTIQTGDSKELNQLRTEGLRDRFEVLGHSLREKLKAETDRVTG